jgi:hypothetical protein
MILHAHTTVLCLTPFLNTLATFIEHLIVCVNTTSGLVIRGKGCNKHAVKTYLTEKHLHIIFSAGAVAYSLLS